MTSVAKRTKPPADEGDTTDNSVTTDSLAQDVADEQLEYLPGTPGLHPILELPRRQRGRAYEVMGRISALQRQLKKDKAEREGTAVSEGDEDGDDKVTEIDPEDFGRQYQVVILIEDYLRVVAADEDEFEAWARKVSDGDLIKTFNIYMRKAQPGEAESSTG